MPRFSKDRGQKACGSLSASLQLTMTQWARHPRASKHTQSSLQDFLPGWCFNFQSVWVNNVWLSGPLLALTISCLNPTAHRAWSWGQWQGFWLGPFYVCTMGQVSISSVSVSSGLNWSIKCCGQMRTFRAAPRALQKSLMFFHLVTPSDSTLTCSPQGSKNGWIRKKEKWHALTIFLSCGVYWIPFPQSCGRLGPSSLSMSRILLFATHICISQGWQQPQRKPAGGSFLGVFEAASFFSFCLCLLEKVRWGSPGKFGLIHGQWTRGWAPNSKHILGHEGRYPDFPKADSSGGRSLWRFRHHFCKI